MKLIEHLKAILASDQLVYDIIKEELLEMEEKILVMMKEKQK